MFGNIVLCFYHPLAANVKKDFRQLLHSQMHAWGCEIHLTQQKVVDTDPKKYFYIGVDLPYKGKFFNVILLQYSFLKN